MYVCICHAITERQIRACVDAGATTLSDLQFELGVATCCGCCAASAAEYLPAGKCSRSGDLRSLAMPMTTAAATAGEGSLQAAPSVSFSLVMPGCG
jgi:bacterioferritin-associated ferredoxin